MLYPFRILMLLVSSPLLFLSSCSSVHQLDQTQAYPNISALKFLNKYVFPYGQKYENTLIGGLSDIDYNPNKDEYYMICDDRSEFAPARFYTTKITVTDTGIANVAFAKVTLLKQKNGKPYPNIKEDQRNVPDPEALRYWRGHNKMVWTSEGDRVIHATDTILINPSVNIIDTNGLLLDTLVLPDRYKMTAGEWGPRANDVFEGVTFLNDHEVLVSMEEPLYQDGSLSDTVEHQRYVRFIRWNLNTKKSTAEYAYHTDIIPFSPTPKNGFKINGISSILYIGNNKVLVVERAFAIGHLNLTVKLYIADLNTATNVQNIVSLVHDDKFTPVKKQLLFTSDSLHTFIDNIEGVTFGPKLSNGHNTLILAVDNNFKPFEENQFYLFEIIP